MFARLTNVRVEHVPFEGSAATAAALAAGTIDIAFDNTLVPHVHAGRVNALAVTSRTRLESLPSVPTLAEAGVPGYDASTWVGLYGTKSMPAAFAESVAGEAAQVLRAADVREALAAQGVQVRYLGPATFASFTADEVRRWHREVQLALDPARAPPPRVPAPAARP
jgi:tripartite-type tricarboxylate transporter receptor subunit TctC